MDSLIIIIVVKAYAMIFERSQIEEACSTM